jgi:threonine dehydrogenase-like Zn-dependent dehydrogenase
VNIAQGTIQEQLFTVVQCRCGPDSRSRYFEKAIYERFRIEGHTVRALVIDDGGRMSLTEVAESGREGQCRIRVRLAGICGTDLQLLEGYAGFRGIPGHEFVGVVESAPPDDAAWIGKRVVGDINVGCGRCRWCEAGVKEHCDNRTVVGIKHHDGAFAECLSLPAVNLHPIPDAMDDETAVFVEPTAAACRILEQMAIAAGARVAVLGDGRMALLVAQVLKTVTADVTVLGRHEEKLAVARALGLTTAVSDSWVAGSARSNDARFEVVVDVTGRPEGLRRALELVRPRGIVVMKSTFHGEGALASATVVVDEVTLIGSRCGPFRPAIELLASGAVQVKPLIARVAPLDAYQSAFSEARHALKVLLAPNGMTRL